MNAFIEKSGKILPYHVTYKHNKNTYYRVKPGFVEVTTNKRYSTSLIQTFLFAHFDKFYQILQHQVFEKDNEISLWGKTYQLITNHGNFRYEIMDDTMMLYTRQEIPLAKKRVYHEEIIHKVKELIPVINPVLKTQEISLIPLKYKYLKSKFGSYHRKHHEITLNTVLAKLDPIFLTYVLYHEYAHTKVFDHSSRFYQLLDELMPGHKTIQKRLKNVVII